MTGHPQGHHDPNCGNPAKVLMNCSVFPGAPANPKWAAFCLICSDVALADRGCDKAEALECHAGPLVRRSGRRQSGG
jgi:hypothetical protein